MTLEAFLARLLVDADLRESFLREPDAEALRAGLGEAERQALRAIDRIGLGLAARSIAAKRRGA
jgi:hypothetical protein